jgi:hypothetical protein
MIAQNESLQPDEGKPARVRASKRPAAQPKAEAPVRLAKSQDPGMVKLTHYLPIELADKLAVATVLRRGCDQSDIIAESLAKTLSSVTFYDRSNRPTRTTDSSMTVTDIGSDQAA